MCGIGGIVVKNQNPPASERLERMKAALASRGPDDSGIFISPGMGMVHTRLSIIDLSPESKCPMSTPDGRYTLVYNGELYNYTDLRDELRRSGVCFRTSGDTETLLLSYRKSGKDALEDFNGMFAFAIWDRQNQELFMARDRLGEKPLYYLDTGSEFVFASTIQAVLSCLDRDLDLDYAALICLLSHQFIPSTHCIFKGIKILPPGHYIIYSARGLSDPTRYWGLPKTEMRLSLGDAEDLIEERLKYAAKSRMIADVDVGGFLSGGIDSSLIMTLMAENTSRRIRTFSVSYEEESREDANSARLVAKCLNTEHSEITFSSGEVLEDLPNMVWHFGQPFCDPALVPIYFLSKYASKQVKVCIGGDGGDEIFGGYSRVQRQLMSDFYRRLKPAVFWRESIPAALSRLNQWGLLKDFYTQKIANFRKLVDDHPRGYTNDFTWLNQIEEITGDQCKTILHGEHSPGHCYYGIGRDAEFNNGKRYLHREIEVLLPDDHLVKIDIASMASALEIRSPFLEHVLVETAWKMPIRYHMDAFNTKILLKKIALKHLPRSVPHRKKMGLSLPLDPWFCGEFGALLANLMRESVLVKLRWIRREAVFNYLEDHMQRRRQHGVRLWILLWLELWARIVFIKSMPRNALLKDYL